MGFRFIHTADWQIGAPFGAFEADLAARLTDARLDMIDRIGAIAMEKGAPHVLVAGDVWDSEQPSSRMLRQPLDLMAKHSDVSWWLMPGNHDPFRRNMLWSRIQERVPENIKPLLEPEPAEVEPSVWLLPAPWTSKSPGRDLTAWMDDAATPADAIRIGIGHGSVTDFSSTDGEQGDSGEKSVIDQKRPDSAGLDYLALGDWHGTLQISERVWYSGTPETDRFRRNDPGHVLVVELAKGKTPSVKAERTTSFEWKILDIDCVPEMEAFPEINQVEGLSTLRNLLLQINLSGQINQKNWLGLESRFEALRERAAFVDARSDGLVHLVSEDDLDSLDRSGSVRMAAERLLEMKEDPAASQADRKTASDALRLLLSFSAMEGRQ